MKVLEEFWYGNLNPMERPFHRQRKFDKVFRLLKTNEEKCAVMATVMLMSTTASAMPQRNICLKGDRPMPRRINRRIETLPLENEITYLVIFSSDGGSFIKPLAAIHGAKINLKLAYRRKMVSNLQDSTSILGIKTILYLN